MRRKTATGSFKGNPRSLLEGKVTELDRHGYGEISISSTGETVLFKLSQVQAPSGHVISKTARKGTDFIGTPVKVSARSVGGKTLSASRVVVGADSGKLVKIGVGGKFNAALPSGVAVSPSRRLAKLKK